MVAKNVKQSIRFILPCFVTSLTFILIFIRIDITEIVESIKRSNYIWIVCAVTVALIADVLIGSHKWRVFLKLLRCKITLWDSLIIRMGTSPIINILPFKLGELSKIICLTRLHKCPLIKSTGSIVGEHCLNLLAAGFLIFLGYIFGQNNPYQTREIAILVITGIFMGICICRLKIFKTFVLRIAKKIPCKSYDVLDNLLSLSNFIGKREFLILFLYSLSFVFTELITFYFLCNAFSISVNFTKILLFVPLIMIICHLPITILGLGTRELSILFFFSSCAPSEKLIGLGISFSLIEYIMPNLIGVVFMWKLSNKLIKLARAF